MNTLIRKYAYGMFVPYYLYAVCNEREGHSCVEECLLQNYCIINTAMAGVVLELHTLAGISFFLPELNVLGEDVLFLSCEWIEALFSFLFLPSYYVLEG